MNYPFQPGDVVWLKSQPQTKMTVESCRQENDIFLVKCDYQNPVTGLKATDEYNSVLLAKESTTETTPTEQITELANSKEMFSNVFSTDGRIRRLEYGICAVAWAILYYFVNGMITSGTPWVVVVLIPATWIIFTEGIKRSHDLGNTGWYILIPFYGLWLLFAEGQSGTNKYGPNPKGESALVQ